jgi:hypothetical protein
MQPEEKQPPSIQQTAIGDGNVQVAGDRNIVTVNQTFIQKVINIFKGDAEAIEQRNRRIMLNHVENFWVRGLLEKSLYGAALLELGIKEDPDALNYPWAIKREANKETLPASTSMLEIFQTVGMGRSLLILGAPGSGKTTMLLELTRQLIRRAREDTTEPIPVVVNLSSWTEKWTITSWLVRELHTFYKIRKEIAQIWISNNKLLLLLDGLDEVSQEDRDKTVNAINKFRYENGLTSIVVCSRSQDYAELKTRLFFDGAIEIQPLASFEVDKYFLQFGNRLAGVQQLLEKDTILREMGETPLFLSIMAVAYKDKDSKDILISKDPHLQRKHLFDNYIEYMFSRPERSKNEHFEKANVLHWIAWLAHSMVQHNQSHYLYKQMAPDWLTHREHINRYYLIIALSISIVFGLIGALSVGLFFSLIVGAIGAFTVLMMRANIFTFDYLCFERHRGLKGVIGGLLFTILMLVTFNKAKMNIHSSEPIEIADSLIDIGWKIGVGLAICYFLVFILSFLIKAKVDYTSIKIVPLLQGLMIVNTVAAVIIGIMNSLVAWQIIGLIISNNFAMYFGAGIGLGLGACISLLCGLSPDSSDLNEATIHQYILRKLLNRYNYLPLRIIPFLDYCVSLIFLRRVGGGYIFVHRLLMEHFAAMYSEDEKAKEFPTPETPSP